jgi:hypothetical protein
MSSDYSQRVARVLKRKFGLDQTTTMVDYEYIERASDPKRYDRMRGDFEAALVQHPARRKKVLRRAYVGPEFAVFVLNAYARSEIEGLRAGSISYYPVCTREEIARIEHPRGTADLLLKLRADEIANDPRLHRVFLRRRELAGSSWSLTSHFKDWAFENYLDSLPDDKRKVCEPAEAGMAFLREPNGLCLPTRWGDIIVVSEALEQYCYFMNVFMLNLDADAISKQDAHNAMYIAVKTMFMTETPDFDLDPRGTPPEKLDGPCRALAQLQLDFVIGHEYAHLLRGHLGPKSATATCRDMRYGPDAPAVTIYTPFQEQEFEADFGALFDADLSDGQRKQLMVAASWFFMGLDIYEEFVSHHPGIAEPCHHPSARARLLRLRAEMAKAELIDPDDFGTDERMKITLERLDRIKESVREEMPELIQPLLVYGSLYLPSYRGSKLFDRVDY